ncbi:hypothetical protein Cantr_03803 [Candida viswanathii]|uniref:Uncharacterized protein n=1 Tax=Candida viswanathii TaxID=5486 RepID=A0A367XNA6_9ASCO|nr:hypothetical protein Cantr_03803 [Candida viswanathii]
MSVSSLSHQVSSSTISLHHQSSIYTLKPRTSTSTLKLKHQPSQLDLIDDTTFTSLPLPPPKRYCSTSSTITTTTNTNTNSSVSSPLSQSIEKFDYHDTYYDDDYEEDYEDPAEDGRFYLTESDDTEIVLVEDYFPCPNNTTANTTTHTETKPGKVSKVNVSAKKNRLWKIFYAISYKYNLS